MSQYIRTTHARGALQAIASDSGLELSAELFQRLAAEHRWHERRSAARPKKGPT